MNVILINVAVSIFTSALSCFVILKIMKNTCRNKVKENQKLTKEHPFAKVNQEQELIKELTSEKIKQEQKLIKEYSFENYFYDIENRPFINMLKEITDNFDKRNPLVLKGKSGSGKTHLLRAIQNEFISKDNNIKTLFVSAETFTKEFLDSIKTNSIDVFNEKYRNLKALFIDDLIIYITKKQLRMNYFIHY